MIQVPKSRPRLLIALFAFSLLVGMPTSVFAWSDRPVRMIVPAPAGGNIDIVARILAEQLSAEIGQPVVVDNRPGAGGAIAVQALNAAAPDGKTIMMTASNVLTEIPHVMKTGFDPLKDVRPVAAVARASLVLVGGAAIPAQDLKGLLAWAKSNPGKLSFASYSTGTSSHYAGMILNQRAGLDLQHVPFQGSPPALTQVIGGEIAIMFDGVATSLPQIKAGRLKAFGLAGKQRSRLIPQVPSLAEQDFPELDFSNWLGVVVSSKVAIDLVEKINNAIMKAAASPKVLGRLEGAGFEANANSNYVELAQSVKADFERNAAIVKTFNIQLNQ